MAQNQCCGQKLHARALKSKREESRGGGEPKAIDIHGPHLRCGWHFYMTFLIPQAHFFIKLISHLKAPTPQDRGDISGGLD